MLKIAINGFGRIGRNFLRALLCDSQAVCSVSVAAINIGPSKPELIAYLFKYDSLMGTYVGPVRMNDHTLIIDEKYYIPIIAQAEPSGIDWKRFAIDWVLESSGKFADKNKAYAHITSGAGNVLISAPAKDVDVNIIPGVNMDTFVPEKNAIVSLGSCTTNAFITLLSVLHQAFGVEKGFMNTVHAYTNSQVLLDVEAKDERRSRGAAINIIPTTTGAARMLNKILPDLADRIDCVAIRVPVVKVSLLDIMFVSKKKLSIELIHAVIEEAKKSKSMCGIIDISYVPLVSTDYSCNNHSVVVDGLLTQVQSDNLGHVFGWYDNEWGYSVRLKEFFMHVAKAQ